MPNAIETERLERITPAVEVELAVIRTSFATKDDVQRILNLLYEHKLEICAALAKQREEFNAALAKQREDVHAVLSQQREDFNAALSQQRDEFNAALAKQREDFYAALTQVQIELHKTLIGHVWKLYGLASLVLGGVYYIARYVH